MKEESRRAFKWSRKSVLHPVRTLASPLERNSFKKLKSARLSTSPPRETNPAIGSAPGYLAHGEPTNKARTNGPISFVGRNNNLRDSKRSKNLKAITRKPPEGGFHPVHRLPAPGGWQDLTSRTPSVSPMRLPLSSAEGWPACQASPTAHGRHSVAVVGLSR